MTLAEAECITVIATHQRAVFNGIDRLAEGRSEFIAVHEDAANTVCPDAVVSETDLQRAASIVGRVLNDPTWLDWLGQSTSRDENGALIPNERLAETRKRLDQFVRQLADLIDSLLVQLRGRSGRKRSAFPHQSRKPSVSNACCFGLRWKPKPHSVKARGGCCWPRSRVSCSL